MSLPTRIGIAVVEFQGCYLVGQRSAETVLPLAAEFPGGKCGPEECPEDCCVRECQEETGLWVETVRLLDFRRHRYPHGEVELHFWLCRPLAGQNLQQVQAPFRWVPAAELAQLPFPEANLPVIQALSKL